MSALPSAPAPLPGCNIYGPSLDICPTTSEIVPQLIAMLPRGRAWGRHDGGPFPNSVPYQFWTAVASVLAYLNKRICDLRLEFWCQTERETNAQWLEEYGFPDNCDPYPNLCAKVAAQGGTQCAYYQQRAAAAGWNVECLILGGQCGAYVGHLAGKAKAGCAKTGRRNFAEITIVVHSATSPSFGGFAQTPSKAGRAKAGRPLSCPPNIQGLVCLLERIVHAEILITYQIV